MKPEGEVQVIDGYFVHFTEDNPKLEALPKYTVFVLDVSGSMQGEKITQLQDAMFTILDDMTEDDYFSILTFSYDVQIWSSNEIVPINKSLDASSQNIMQATRNNLDVAITFTNSLHANGGTNIDSAMLKGLELAKENMEREGLLPANTQPMIVFLTDGVPTSGVTHKPTIKSNIVEANHDKMPLYCIAFGRDADFKLMKEISEEADSWAKMIYEGGDAAIQLENFFAQISDPVISGLKFEYVGVKETDADVVNDEVNVVLRGSSYTHVGKLQEGAQTLEIKLLGERKGGRFEKVSKIWCEVGGDIPTTCEGCVRPSQRTLNRTDAQSFMQRLHAFSHIKKLIKRGNKAEREGLLDDDKRALRLALDNNFVTSLTSLVVTTAQNGTTLASLGDEIVQDFPSRRNYMSSYSGGGYRSAGGISHVGSGSMQSYPTVLNSPIPSGGRRGGVRGRSRISVRGSVRGSGRSSSSRSSSSSRRSSSSSRSRSSSSSSRWAESSDESLSSDSSPHVVTTTTIAPQCQGNMTLWSRTYLRGESFLVSDDIEDLNLHGFDNKLVSLEVSAGCCWTIFSEPHFQGDSKVFREGQHKSVSSVGKLFRAASSVKKTSCY